MKIFTIILSMYFLGLNFAPCGDMSSDTNDTKTEYSQTTDADHNHVNSDLCSPFCHCHCCHVHTIDFGLYAFEPLQPIAVQLSTVHFDSRGKDYQDSLLQPPRV